jgi:hypothetical protein
MGLSPNFVHELPAATAAPSITASCLWTASARGSSPLLAWCNITCATKTRRLCFRSRRLRPTHPAISAACSAARMVPYKIPSSRSRARNSKSFNAPSPIPTACSMRLLGGCHPHAMIATDLSTRFVHESSSPLFIVWTRCGASFCLRSGARTFQPKAEGST